MVLSPCIIAAHHVNPSCVAGKKSKKDAIDAASICEAASRPYLQRVLNKTAHQQCVLAVHRFVKGYKKD